ncbi:urease accessory protein UreF [Trichothermofontia sp.]
MSPILLTLLQLASPALPVGAFSYSEGLETLVTQGVITDAIALEHWLTQELQYGAIRIDGVVLLRCYQAFYEQDQAKLRHWNQWLSAMRECEELRQQSWQMGWALARLLPELYPSLAPWLAVCQPNCNFAAAFGLVAAQAEIPPEMAIVAYLHSWSTNLINAGIKLIPLGQTIGQVLLFRLQIPILEATAAILSLVDDDLDSCNWGISLSSMQHQEQYSRLFRS